MGAKEGRSRKGASQEASEEWICRIPLQQKVPGKGPYLSILCDVLPPACLAPTGQLSAQTSFFIIRLDRKTNQDQVYTPRREISDPIETRTDLGPNSPFPTCEFHFTGEALEFSSIFIPLNKREDCIFLKGTSVRLNVIM